MDKSELIGKKIRIINMRGEPDYAGKEGIIEHIDALGQLHGTWGSLATQFRKDNNLQHKKIKIVAL